MQFHKKARIQLKAGSLKRFTVQAMRMQQQLCFYSGQVRRMLQRFQQSINQLQFDGDRSGFIHSLTGSEDVSDDCLIGFVDAKDVPADTALIQGSVAAQQVRFDVLQYKAGRTAIVPVQALAPKRALFVQQRPKMLRGEMSQIKKFEFECGGHD